MSISGGCSCTERALTVTQEAVLYVCVVGGQRKEWFFKISD